jgi:hypothetical protein
VDQLLIVDLGGNEDAAREAATTLALGCRNKGTVLWSSEPRGTTFSAGFNGAAAGCAAEIARAERQIPPQIMLQWGRGQHRGKRRFHGSPSPNVMLPGFTSSR